MPVPFKQLLIATLPMLSIAGTCAAAESAITSPLLDSTQPSTNTGTATPTPTDWDWPGQICQTVDEPVILPPPVPPEDQLESIAGVRG